MRRESCKGCTRPALVGLVVIVDCIYVCIYLEQLYRPCRGAHTGEVRHARQQSESREGDTSGLDWQIETQMTYGTIYRDQIVPIVSSVFRFLKTPRFVISAMNRPLSAGGMLPRLRQKIPEMRLLRGSVAV